MHAFKENGVYLKLNDMTIDGYYTNGKDGKLRRNKYGLLDKLYDIYKYGKTKEIYYSYIYFQAEPNNDPALHMGALSSELTQLLANKRLFGTPHSRINYSFISDNKIKYFRTNNSECFLTSLERRDLIIMNCINDPDTSEYQFYLFT